MDNVSIEAVLDSTRGARVLFYLVSPNETSFEHVKDVPNYTHQVNH